MDIRFIPREEIDKVKWNSCVHYANNGNVFGYMWFLDYVAKDWDALVEGDYESVFPLVWRTNALGRRELFQPPLMREMGVYTINAPSQARVRRFLAVIPEEYRRVDIHLNEQNAPPAGSGFDVEPLLNHQLLLQPPYEILAEGFSEATRAAIRRAGEAGLRPNSNLKPEAVAGFYRRHTADRRGRERTFHALQRIMYNALHRGWGFASGVQGEAGEWLAVNFFIYSHGRVMSLSPVQSAAGEARGALPFLFDMLLRTHAGRPLVLDFNTRGADELARGFGALPNPYYRVLRDRRVLKIW